MKKDSRNNSRLIKPEIELDEGLTESEKLKMFFFGIVIIIITGTRVFYHLPGNEKQKKQTFTYYIGGVLFWLIIIGSMIFILQILKI